MPHTRTALLTAALAFAFSPACTRLQEEGRDLADKAEKAVRDQAEALTDKVIPHFDAGTPDTKYNRQRFTEFLRVPLTPDVQQIWCHGDAMGIDADFQFAFCCDTGTVRRIREAHQLRRDTGSANLGQGFQTAFPWWDLERIARLDRYAWTDSAQYHKYFWYDAAEGQAYYFDFDM